MTSSLAACGVYRIAQVRRRMLRLERKGGWCSSQVETDLPEAECKGMSQVRYRRHLESSNECFRIPPWFLVAQISSIAACTALVRVPCFEEHHTTHPELLGPEDLYWSNKTRNYRSFHE